jgi:hypothetical protein
MCRGWSCRKRAGQCNRGNDKIKQNCIDTINIHKYSFFLYVKSDKSKSFEICLANGINSEVIVPLI